MPRPSKTSAKDSTSAIGFGSTAMHGGAIIHRSAIPRSPQGNRWLTADAATRVSAKPKPRSHLAGLLRSERQLLANPPFNDSDTALRDSARHDCEAYPQDVRGANGSWSKDDDVRFFSLSASNGDLSCLGNNERNLPEAKARRGPSERARASHWAGVRCRNDGPPKGNANFAWVQHFIHHLAPHGMAGLNAVRQYLANGSMSSNQSGDNYARQ